MDIGAERDIDWTTTRWSRQCVGVMADELVSIHKSDLEGQKCERFFCLHCEHSGLGMHIESRQTCWVDIPGLDSSIGPAKIPQLHFAIQAAHDQSVNIENVQRTER